MGTPDGFMLSPEQQLFIQKALQGQNILVDACIGSGKTTAIMHLCSEFPVSKKVLYLTYNKLLKLDAKSRIKRRNATVTNYHGFAYMLLQRIGKSAGISDLIQTVIREKPPVAHYDILMIDEYQDIEQELAELLQMIKSSNPRMQIIAVGDMEQKIYDKTTLRAETFIKEFLEDHITLKFTRCFRLSAPLAALLGRIWNKQILGVNPDCIVETMTKAEILPFLAKQFPADILCLGARTGAMSDTLNQLEEKYPNRFNKGTVYATISENDSMGKAEPRADSAIFTTFDSSKGLERKICVIFDFTESYWHTRITKPEQKYVILRNIFCVAASRGKDHIIFVESTDALLSEKTLSTFTETNHKFEDLDISDMFDFKYKEDVEACFSEIKTVKLPQKDRDVIRVKGTDGLIDLSPCIGIYQEAAFFDHYQIDEAILLKILLNPELEKTYTKEVRESSLDQKILYLVSLETRQKRYRTQVIAPFVSKEQSDQIKARLKTRLNRNERAQAACRIDFSDQENGAIAFSARGFADAVKDEIVYELKFVSELTREHFLQCACYLTAMNLQKGILWNTRDNTVYEIEVPDKKAFLDAVTRAVTKGMLASYYKPADKAQTGIENLNREKKAETAAKRFAVLDTETNWNDQVMSVGVVIADADTMRAIHSYYYIFDPEYRADGMYAEQLGIEEYGDCIMSRKQAVRKIKQCLDDCHVRRLFAYNASFDQRHLPELSSYEWYDIMRLAAYRQYNKTIPAAAECYKTGRLKRGYSVEQVLKMLQKNEQYSELHNAASDAEDELEIMRLLGCGLSEYNIARI